MHLVMLIHPNLYIYADMYCDVILVIQCIMPVWYMYVYMYFQIVLPEHLLRLGHLTIQCLSFDYKTYMTSVSDVIFAFKYDISSCQFNSQLSNNTANLTGNDDCESQPLAHMNLCADRLSSYNLCVRTYIRLISVVVVSSVVISHRNNSSSVVQLVAMLP